MFELFLKSAKVLRKSPLQPVEIVGVDFLAGVGAIRPDGNILRDKEGA